LHIFAPQTCVVTLQIIISNAQHGLTLLGVYEATLMVVRSKLSSKLFYTFLRTRKVWVQA